MKRPPDNSDSPKPLRILDAARDELMDVPEDVRHDFGFELYRVQCGRTPDNASPFEGSTAGNIMKLVERHNTDTYRCVYTAKFEKAVYVLYVFKKKSMSGIATPRREIETVKARFKQAQELYAQAFGPQTETPPAHGGKEKR